MANFEHNSYTLQETDGIPPLSFVYERTYDPDQASITQWRDLSTWFGEGLMPLTDHEILERVKQIQENKNWFTYEYWREKGLPEEQIEFQLSGQIITVYNWNEDQPFTDEHIQKTTRVFQELTSRFPQIAEQIRWVIIDDQQVHSEFGDSDNYPLNGYALRAWKAVRLLPRGMGFQPHRIARATNFEGTLAHESAHFIQNQFESEWRERFTWEDCDDHPDEWEVRFTPDGTLQKWFNKQTGEMSPQGQFAQQPDQCINYYAKQNMGEDICDSLVAYIFDPEQLEAVSTDKLNIFKKHDARLVQPIVTSRRVPKEEIKLPEPEEKTIYYYVREPAENSSE